MERNDAKRQLQQLGLKVTNTGIIKDENGLGYGVLNRVELKTPDDMFIPLDEIDFFGRTPKENRMTVTKPSGEKTDIFGYDYNEEEEAAVKIEKMPKSLLALNKAFDRVYPDALSCLYYDELQELDYMDLRMIGMPDRGFMPLSDKICDVYQLHFQRMLTANGYVGDSFPAKETMAQVLSIRTFENTRNRFREWMTSHVWDGKPRVRRWFIETFGATAPPLDLYNGAEKYLEDVSEAWFLGAVARNMTNHGVQHDIVPVLISDQGIGKGHALQYTAGQDEWYVATTEAVLDAGRFLDKIRGHIVVELSEGVQLKSASSGVLKGFISLASDQMRKAYGHHHEVFPRHFVFIMTTNEKTLFTDETGNRRFFPMFLDGNVATREFSVDRDEASQYEVEQVWAEALQMYKDGHSWDITDPETDKYARIMQKYCSVENTSVEAIEAWLDDPLNGYSDKGDRITKGQLLEQVFGIRDGTRIPADIQQAYVAWYNSTKSWVKLSKTTRVRGLDKPTKSAYERIVSVGETKSVPKLKMKRKKVIKGKEQVFMTDESLIQLVKDRAKEYGFSQDGDDFPVDGLSPALIEQLEMNGLLYEVGAGKNVIYKVVMP